MEPNVQFDTPGNEFGRPPQASGSDMTDTLIKWGLVGSKQEAEYVLIGVAVLAIVASFLVYPMLSGSSDEQVGPNYGTTQQI